MRLIRSASSSVSKNSAQQEPLTSQHELQIKRPPRSVAPGLPQSSQWLVCEFSGLSLLPFIMPMVRLPTVGFTCLRLQKSFFLIMVHRLRTVHLHSEPRSASRIQIGRVHSTSLWYYIIITTCRQHCMRRPHLDLVHCTTTREHSMPGSPKRLHTRLLWLLGVGLWMGLCYFPPQLWPLRPASPPPAMAWEMAVPFMPSWAVVYQSVFLLHCAAFWVGDDMAAIRRYGRSVCAAFTTGAFVFWMWPTSIDRPQSDNPAFQWLISNVDGSRNAFPSLHAALSALVVIRFWNLSSPALKVALALWLPVLLFSTLATRQHQVIDLFSGLLLGMAIAWLQHPLAFRYSPQERAAPGPSA